MLFTFRRDAEGRETIHVGDVIAWQCHGDMRTNAGRNIVSPPAGVTMNHIYDAMDKAEKALFWQEVLLDWYTNEVAVDVPVAETTSTILSLTTEDER